MASVPGLGWAAACLRILQVGSDDPDQAFRALVAAAREFADVDGASVVSWQQSGPRQLAVSGPRLELPAERLTSPVTSRGGSPVVSVPVRGEVDLVAWRRAGRAGFLAEEIEVLRLLAVLAGIAVGRPEAALSMLYGVARKLLGSRDLEEVLLEIVTTVAQLLHTEIAGVFLVSADGQTIDAKAVVGNRTVETARLKVKKGQGLVGHVFQTGAIYRVNDWATDPVISKEFSRIAHIEGTQTSIGAPMKVDGETVGVIAAWRRRRSLFSDDDANVIRALADLGAVAVQRAVAAEAMRGVSASLVDANSALAQRVQEAEHALRVHEGLTRLVVDGAELPAVIDALSEVTGRDVAVVGFEGTVIQTGPRWLADLLHAQRRHKPPRIGATASLLGPDSAGRHAIAVKIRSAGFEWAELAIAADRQPLALDVLAAEQAATACAVLLSRQDAVAAAVRRLESEFVWDLLEGRIGSEAEAIARAHQLARELPARARVVLLSADPPAIAPTADRPTPDQLERASLGLARRLAELLDSHGAHARYGRRGRVIAMIIPDSRSLTETRRLGGEILELGRNLAGHVSVGISAPVTAIGQYPAGYRQATHAMQVSSPADSSALLFEDLGVLQFLLEPAHRADLDRYVTQVLGALIDYDRKHGSNLVGTVAAYLQADCHLQHAAAMLFIHHKTMAYRLVRISALSGLQLDSQEDRFRLHLALKILGLRRVAARPVPDGQAGRPVPAPPAASLACGAAQAG